MEDIGIAVKDVLDSERLLTARMVDSVLRTCQMAGAATPEMQEMFGQWLALVGEQVLRESGAQESAAQEQNGKGECDVPAVARAIGVSEATVFSLLTFLHRSGRIRVEAVRFSDGGGRNPEGCSCLTQ